MYTKFSELLENHKALQSRMVASRFKLGEIRTCADEHEALKNNCLCVFAAGSLGRLEAGEKSDFDVFMIASEPNNRKKNLSSISRLEEYETFSSLIQINQTLSFPRFSGDGRFLKTYELDEMIKATGSPRDDSENLFTARMLLLLESQPITNQELYTKGINDVVSNYYRDGSGKEDFRPLFLLNDILRYWRTLCLNYEDLRSDKNRPWFKKNLNLKFSRKLTIYSTVFGIVSGLANDKESFKKLCELTPMERLAKALDNIEDETLLTGFEKLLNNYELFLRGKEKSIVSDEAPTTKKRRYSNAAKEFDLFLHEVINSQRIDGLLRRYLLI
ncbi:MAG: hypothetical protein SFU55_05280 [Methylophilus sp.]|nr:hypothetical protein [Methylophilus sp.]